MYLRNKEDYISPRYRLESFRKSSIPYTVKQWNLVIEEVREAISINSFRINLETKVKIYHRFLLLASDIPISDTIYNNMVMALQVAQTMRILHTLDIQLSSRDHLCFYNLYTGIFVFVNSARMSIIMFQGFTSCTFC